MQYLNKKLLFVIVGLVAIVGGALIYLNYQSYGSLVIRTSQPAELVVRPLTSGQAVQTFRLENSQELRLKAGHYLIDAVADGELNTVVTAEVKNQQMASTELDFKPLQSALIASSVSARSLGPIGRDSLLVTDAGNGSLQRLTNTSQSLVSPFLASSTAVAFDSNHSGLLSTTEGKLYYFDTSARPISRLIDHTPSQRVSIFFDSKLKYFILSDGASIYRYRLDADAVELVARIADFKPGNLYTPAADGGKVVLLAQSSEGGEEGIVLPDNPLDSFLVDSESGNIKILENTSGLAATISPDGITLGVYDGISLRFIHSNSLETIGYGDGGSGDYQWVSTTDFLYAKGGGVWTYSLESRKSRKLVSVDQGTPSHLTLTSNGELYFVNTNGSELVIFRSSAQASLAADTKGITFPVRTSEYKIDLTNLFGAKPTLTITTYAIVNNPSRDFTSFSSQTSSFRKKALAFLKDKGLEISQFSVRYVPNL